MVDPLVLVGGLSGAFGITGFAYQVYKKRQEVEDWKAKKQEAEDKLAQIEDEKQALEEEKQALEDEKKTLKASKDEYEEIVAEVRSIIGDIQDAMGNGGVDRDEMASLLDRLETTVLPKDDQILSKLTRLSREVRKTDDTEDRNR